MPSRGRASAFHPGPRSDLESHGFAPEFVPTAGEQRLQLFTHIIRAIGVTIALMFNAIIYIPFFIFGILPLLIKKRFCSSPVYPLFAPTEPNSQAECSKGIFSSHDHHRNRSPDGDVSPLLLSTDTGINDVAPYGEPAVIFRGVQETFPQLPDPMIDFPSIIGGYATYDAPTIMVTQPPTPSLGSTPYGSSSSSTRSDDGTEDEGLMMNNTHSVDLLVGTPKFGGCHASGANVPGHGQDAGGNVAIKRERTWDNLQDAVYPS